MEKEIKRASGKRCAVVTGASSGIGREFARILGRNGYYLVITGRNEKALNALKNEIGEERCTVITADLADTRACIDLCAEAMKFDPDILINNAGFGVYGEFTETSLSRELEMIDVNIKAMHILFKLFTRFFVKKGRGQILNVASSAGLMPGPLMSSYYSSKSYVIRQTQAVHEELRRRKSGVKVSVLCPGPVDTEFNARAGISGFMKSITAKQCAEYTLKRMGHNSLMIIPTVGMQLAAAAVKIAPERLTAAVSYSLQKGKKQIHTES
ncbi:MAG: SDR family NAD(P)-dependent oxidoreductase [Ruminococcus sp.]|nr:SDR family NAD(P)-dependent oxidoreductase [Ruminococcus sp.]